MRLRGPAVGLLGIVSATIAAAQTADPREQLIDLATIEVAHDLCQFDLSQDQEDAIARRREQLIQDGSIVEADVSAVHDEIAASMKGQVSEGLCRKDGPEARLYRQKLTELGIL